MKDYYEKDSPGREDYWRKMAAPRFRVETFLKHIPQSTQLSIVDMGCGNGALLNEIKRQHPDFECSGLDQSVYQINQNRKADPGTSWYPVDLSKKDALPEELKDKFDIVFAAEIIEHVQDPLVFLKNAHLLAKPNGGRLLLSTQSGKIHETEKRVGHLRHFKKGEMEELLNQSGWNPDRVWNAGYPFHNLSKWFANLNPDKTMKKFSDEGYGSYQNFICWGLRTAFQVNSNQHGAQLFAVGKK